MEATIGIEVHVELKNMAKVFSMSKNNFNDPINTNINVIDLGYPGVLPRLNKGVIDYALKAALALNCNINQTMHFDRKNYFYPDLPKAYQITEQDTPIGYDGYVKISNKKIEIERIHIEEDTCKSIHTTDTLLNFNRAGVPLIEIVTKPCIKNGKEAIEYLEKLRETLLYLGISDVKIEEGSMRCDVNVSVSDTDVLGTKCEVKNIGSISNVGLAIDYEINRQIEELSKGNVIKEQTRRFDDKTSTTILMRYKETGNDYRYFPEPDIPYVVISDEWLNEIKDSMPILTDELRDKYKSLNINDNAIKTIISNKDICNFLESVISLCNPVIAANLLTGEVLSYLNKNIIKISQTKLSIDNFVKLVNLLDKNTISSKQGKQILGDILQKETDVDLIIKENNMQQINDDNFILEIITKVLESNPDSINDYKEGKDRAIKYLMGQVMKESKGKVNPSLANKLLIDKLSKF
jgi:aspartyl-tRNA(Asn)/glutamyl-tRNA(Gln) amidotransferase subunit B